MNLPNPVLVGFFPKITEDKPDGFDVPEVAEICSVSECISKGPHDWVNKWRHNILGFYDSETLARSVIDTNADEFDLYAYKLYPFQFDNGTVLPFKIPVCLEDKLVMYQFLGYDPVSKSTDFFECSPLSCNYAAKKFSVNRH